MMCRYPYKKYLIIGAALFLILSLPALFVERMRGTAIGALSLVFRGGNLLVKSKMHETERLEAENHLLRIEIGKLRALLEQKAKAEACEEELCHYALTPRHYDEIKFLAQLSHQAIPARVIYRDPGSWSSSLWVNVGEETNRVFNQCVIQKNSPVILGRSVVGAVDYVGKKQSRIRLITDVALKPSVRAVRGLPQNMALIEHIDPILRHLNGRNDLALSGEERAFLSTRLKKWRENLSVDVEGWYLGKGILQGGGAPLWRSVHHTLRGTGFNYDVADEEGPARELTTGKPIEASSQLATVPIIQLNDLLVTTGMDGVFPPGLRVAQVTKIYPMREGAYTYEIEATPVVGNLDTLQTVFIIPPLGFEKESANENR
jgi:rod shape-determining protein MreC